MFSRLLSPSSNINPQPGKQARGRAEPAAAKPAKPQVAALVSTPAGHRRWTVVVPRRLTERAAQAEVDAEAFHAALPPAPDPVRFGPQATMFGLIAAVASGLYLYSAKHAAATLDGQITRAFELTGSAHQQTSLLRAEWALLNNPDRLHPLAGRYLALQPLAAAQYVKLSELHHHLPGILYGPPQPLNDEDAGAPPIAVKRLLAMATAPAAPDAEPDRPAGPPVVSAPADAIRVLAHAGTLPDVIGADGPPPQLADASGETGYVDAEPSRAESGRLESAQPEPVRIDPPRIEPSPRAAHAVTAVMRPQRPIAPAIADTIKLLARAEPRPHVVRVPAMLRPELVHELMLPHVLTPSWQARPRVSYALAAPPPRRPVYARSEPPHDLTMPNPLSHLGEQQEVAAEAPADDQPRARIWDAAPNYVAPPRFPYRPPYWAYPNPYGGGPYIRPPAPTYPGYQ